LKAILVSGLITLGIAAAGVVYFVNYKPTAPSGLTVVTVQDPNFPLNVCSPILNFYDRAVNEDDLRVYRRKSGVTAWTLVMILPPGPGKGKMVAVADPSPLPQGTYEYRVSAYNAYGEAFGTSSFVTVDAPDCKNVTPPANTNAPPNPIIVSLTLVNNCTVHLVYRDNSTNEQGLQVYRAKKFTNFISYDKESLIATLPAHSGIPGSYDDKSQLEAGTYHYRMAAYNGGGTSFSNYVEITIDPICNPAMQSLPTKASTPMLGLTPQKLSATQCTLEVQTDVFLRKGPDVARFDRLAEARAGQLLEVLGQSQDGQFWAVQTAQGLTGYIVKSDTYVQALGDCGGVPTLTDPAPPQIVPTATRRPSRSKPECSDGRDNDGDGRTDYSPTGSGDPGCSSAGDTSE
jgi:hypothetical protein